MELTLEALKAYLTACRTATGGLVVLGHPAPDGDAIISSLFEGWRRTLAGTPAIPVVAADTLPREVDWLLGDVAPLLLTRLQAAELLDMPQTRFVLTDHHTSPYRSRVVAVVDHHPVAPGTDLTGIETCIRPMGATTTLVAMDLRCGGYEPDTAVARILLGAILLDTEGLSPAKTHTEDIEVVAWLASLCGEQPADFFGLLQAALLSERNVSTLYHRDYRTYTTPSGEHTLGFAILKVWRDALPDRQAVRRLLAEDQAQRGYAACVAKIALYAPDGREREEVYLAAGPAAAAMLDEVRAMGGPAAVVVAPDELYLPAACSHRGRKWLAVRLLERLEG